MKYQIQILVILVVTLNFSCTAQRDTQNKTESISANQSDSMMLDLDDPADNLIAFAKVRGSLAKDEEVIYYANGKIYGVVNGERDKHLMDYEMYNIARLNKVEENHYQLLTREVLLYINKESGEVLETFDNPYNEKSVKVFHVWNDPVNQNFMLEGKYGKWGVNHNKLGKDMICMNADVLLIYPSPLTTKEYPENSQSDMYEAGELFQFFVSEEELNDPTVSSTECTISWTRIGPWLPWMEMGQRPGMLLYQGAGYKLLEKDYNQMPKVLTEYVLKTKPEYRHAPTEFTSPNETSWTYYKKMNPRK